MIAPPATITFQIPATTTITTVNNTARPPNITVTTAGTIIDD